MDTEIIIFYSPWILLLLSITLFSYFYIKKHLAYKEIYLRFKDLVDINKEVEQQNVNLSKLRIEFEELDKKYKEKNAILNNEYQNKRSTYEKLLKEISILEENLDFISYGLYKPHYDFNTSEGYINKLEIIREKQKEFIRDKKAIVCHTVWSVDGSNQEGQKMTNEYMKLMLRAFNNECDAAVLKVKWHNIQKMEERIKKAYEAINKLGSTHKIEITNLYLSLMLEELRLTYEYQEKLHEEKEELRRIREQMREEEKIQKEIEKAKKEAEDEEERYQKALEQAKNELEKAKGEEVDRLNSKIESLQKQLTEAIEKKERALSQAQMTKRGYIYVLSNIGSFGENIFKIGMTRRFDPNDRVRELGDASVPFGFDIHAMIFSENAPELENNIHKEFENKKINLINLRREFFNVSLDEIKEVVIKHHGEIEFTKIAEAKEYRESIAMRDEDKNIKTIEKKIEEKFPMSL